MILNLKKGFEKLQGDLKPEIHYMGQVLGAKEFNVGNNGIFCEMKIETSWVLFLNKDHFMDNKSF